MTSGKTGVGRSTHLKEQSAIVLLSVPGRGFGWHSKLSPPPPPTPTCTHILPAGLRLSGPSIVTSPCTKRSAVTARRH